jgi:hypothetical protein
MSDEIYREDKWRIIDSNDYQTPCIVHLCEGSDERTYPKWNFVGRDIGYSCVRCFKKAPERVITILELYR